MVYITLFHARHTKANIPTSVNNKDASTRKISDLAKTEVPSHSKTNNTESSNKTQCCVWFNRGKNQSHYALCVLIIKLSEACKSFCQADMHTNWLVELF